MHKEPFTLPCGTICCNRYRNGYNRSQPTQVDVRVNCRSFGSLLTSSGSNALRALRRSPGLRLFSHGLRQQWLSFLTQWILCLCWSAKEALLPWLLKAMINALSVPAPKLVIWRTLLWNSSAIGGLWFTMEIAMRCQGWLARRSFPQWRLYIRSALFEPILQQLDDELTSSLKGNTASKISDIPRACENLLEIVLLHITSLGAATLIMIVLLGNTRPIFAVIALVWVVLHVAIAVYQATHCQQSAIHHAETVANLNGQIVDLFTNRATVLLFTNQQHERQRFNIAQQTELRAAQQARGQIEKVKILHSVLALLYLLSLLSGLLIGWRHDLLSPGDFALVPMLACSLLGMVGWFSHQIPAIFREVGIIQAGLRIIASRQPPATGLPLAIPQGEILFHRITFSYPNQPPRLVNFSLSIPARQKIGVIGLSGAGKSTLIKLLLRFYPLTHGTIRLDGQDINSVSPNILRQQIAVVPQEVTLFHRTLYENIHYGCLEATAEAVYTAARITGCHDFIQPLPQGYHTLIGAQGFSLSGGQRQRIGLARAILKNSPILIFDEATSSLDVATECELQRHLSPFLADKTVITIAHRRSTLEPVERIVVLAQGTVVADGDKETLLKNNHYFQQLSARDQP
ncbi:MAG: ABC transporter ATP-binding protein [Candidatus Symbiodolus clandestinus]